MTPFQTSIYEAAKLYASIGWHVVPLYGLRSDGTCHCKKGGDCTSPGKHPCLTAWQKNATFNLDLITKWFADDDSYPRFPANLGVHLGPESGIVDFEYDNAAGAKLIKNLFGGKVPRTMCFNSGKGGHLLFKYRDDILTGANVNLAGCDLKLGHGQKGSQSVMPPSQHYKNPLGYRWSVSPNDCELAEIPDIVVENLQKRGENKAGTNGSPDAAIDDYWMTAVKGAPQGARNHAMTRIVGKLLRQCSDIEGVGQMEVFLRLQEINGRFKPPLDPEELTDVFFSIWGAEVKRRKAGDGQKLEYTPVPISDISEVEQVDWLWEGWLPANSCTLLVGEWKSGKTTFYTSLLRAFAAGGELAGGTVSPAKCLVITEESEGLWKERHEVLEIGPHVSILSRPFLGSPNSSDWQQLISRVTADVEANLYDCIVIDPWTNLNPCADENDARATSRALTPLYGLMNAGASILLVHHGVKGPAALGKLARGSGALQGFVDTVIEFRRVTQEASDTRRKIQGLSRYSETPREAVGLDFREGQYVMTEGSTPEMTRRTALLDVIGLKWVSVSEIDRLVKEKIPERTLSRYLQKLVTQSLLESDGKNKHAIYRKPAPGVISKSVNDFF